MREKDIVKAIERYLKTLPECFFWKEHGGMYGKAGLPDICCCVKGRFVAFEVKTPDGRLSRLQEITLRKIREAGGAAHKVTNAGEVRQIIQELEDR